MMVENTFPRVHICIAWAMGLTYQSSESYYSNTTSSWLYYSYKYLESSMGTFASTRDALSLSKFCTPTKYAGVEMDQSSHQV